MEAQLGIREVKEGEHELDALALPQRRLGGGGGSIPEALWMKRWPKLAGDLNLLHDLNAGTKPVALADFQCLDEAADPDADPEDALGEIARFADAVLRSAADWAASELEESDRSFHALLLWQIYVSGVPLDAMQAEPAAAPVFEDFARLQEKSPVQKVTDRMWRTGRPDQLSRRAVRGLRVLALAFFDELQAIRDARALVGPVTEEEGRELLVNELLPQPLAETFVSRVLDVQARAYSRLPHVLSKGENMLLLGPAGCGKSVVGQVAAGAAVHRALREGRTARALFLVPTKPLVRENKDRWDEWVKADESHKWRIVAGSADDREYDEALANGDYDVGICVYEKLANLLYNQRDVLKKVGVIIVDELQYINDPQRGEKLEALLTIIRRTFPSIPIIGLSATLTPSASRALQRWLDVRHLVDTTRRPTDLWVHVIDGEDRRSWLEPSADMNDDGSPVVPRDEHRKKHPLKVDGAVHEAARRARADIAVAQATALLEDASESDRRVLCFVGQRARAADVAQVIRAAIAARSPLRAHNGDRFYDNPWVAGRYAADLALSEDERKQRFVDLMALEDDEWREHVLEGLHSGIGYHSRTLERPLQRVVEREFRSGLLRVLVATDTLAEGVNLPASDVIVMDLDRFDPQAGSYVLIDRGLLRNRIGRASRLGTRHDSLPGNSYIVLNPATPKNRLAPEDRPRVSVIDPAWEHWVKPRATAKVLRSRLAGDAGETENLDALCGLVLSALAVEKRRLGREDMLREVEDILGGTFWAEGGPVELGAVSEAVMKELEHGEFLESSEQVLGELIDRTLVGPPDDRPDQLQITTLGLSIVRSSLPLTSSNTIKSIAADARRGRPTISRLFAAAADEHIARSLGRWINWHRIPKWESRDLAERGEHVIRQVVQYAAMYVHPDVERREEVSASWQVSRRRGKRRIQIPAPAAIWRTEAAPAEDEDLHAIVTGERELSEDPRHGNAEADHDTAVALLRAVVALERVRFQPRREFGLRLNKISAYKRANAVDWSPVDLTVLGESCGFVLSAAADYLDNALDAQRELRHLAFEVATGVPLWLAPLQMLHVDGVDREVLLRAHATGRGPVDDLASVLEWPELNLSGKTRELAKARYHEMRQEERDVYRQLPRDLDGLAVDGLGYQDLWTGLSTADSPERLAQQLERLLDRHVAAPEEPLEPADERTVRFELHAEERTVPVIAVLGEITDEQLGELVPDDSRVVLLPMEPPTHRALTRIQFDEATTMLHPRALVLLLHALNEAFPDAESLEGPLADLLGAVSGVINLTEAKRLATELGLPHL